ncbi:MAG: TlpA disulfide reductase family protein [Saprospiraceae bacterium]|nr:TlpA disulfide reductase family protein [Saprospiraceae bacterium]
MKRKISLLAYGLMLVLIWGICFLGSGMSDPYTAAMGLSFTFISIYFLQKKYDFKLTYGDKVAVVLFPLLYVILVYYTLITHDRFSPKKTNYYQLLFYLHLINPLNVAFVGLLLGLTKLKDLSKPVNIFIFSYIVLFYAYFFHTPWMGFWAGTRVKNFNTELFQDADAKNADGLVVTDDLSLTRFLFINPELDTINLVSHSGKYILLETWSENCPPCIRAMQELPEFYQSIQDKVDVYYVYENNAPRVRRKFDAIFSFKGVQDKSKILIDINQDFYNTLEMQGFPYFLLFDAEGRLVYHKRGYEGKNVLSREILKHIQ